MTEAEPLLAFVGAQAQHHEDHPLFPPIDLAVGAGDVGAITGRSGSGKSTALAMAMGLFAPTTGTILWHGTDLYALDDDARAEIRRDGMGIVLQDGGLIHGLTAVDNVLVPALRRRATTADRRRAEALLEQVGLGHRIRSDPSRLSGGEIQRVAIARALFSDPELLVVDEPTASLDDDSADTVIGLLRDVASGGGAVLVASHDPAVIDVATHHHAIHRP